MKSNKIRYFVVSVLSFCVFILIWELATDVFRLMPSYSLPSPFEVVESFIYKLTNTKPDGATLFQHIFASLTVSVSGFLAGALIGIPLGILMAWNKSADLLIRPIFDLFRSVPGLAWIPIMILIFGVGLTAKAAIVFAVSFVPVIINTYAGIKNVSSVHLWVAQTFGGSRGQLLTKVAIPSALPLIFTGLRQALNMAWVSLVAAELLGSARGLGFMIQMNRDLSRADLIIVGMLTIGAIGAILSAALLYIENRFVKGGV